MFAQSIKDKAFSYFKKLKKSGLSDKSLEVYTGLINHFINWIEDYEIVKSDFIFEEKDIENFIGYLKAKNLSPTTIKMVLNRTKEFIEFSGGKFKANKRIYRERSKTESAKPYSELELKQILEHLKNHSKIYYYLSLTLYGFGLRISEATQLLPDDIIEKEGQIFVRVRPEISKFLKARESPLILKGNYREDFIDFLIRRKNPKLKDKTLFTYYNDVQKRIITIDRHNVKNYFNKLSKILNINITAHRFRDTYISYMISKGIKPITVSKWVGHKDINTTLKYYTKLTTKDELDELTKI